MVSTRVLRPSQAVIMAACFNLVGAFLGVEVAKTIGKGIVDTGAITQLTILSALLGAIVWNLITWYFGIPSSSSHAIIGGVCGSTSAYAGFSVIKLNGLANKVFVPMIASPVAGIVLGFVIMLGLYWLLVKVKPGLINRIFSKLQIVSACFMALSHGSNDAQKTMGIITMALMSYTVLTVSGFSYNDNMNTNLIPSKHAITIEHKQKIISNFINGGGFIVNENGTYKAYKKTDTDELVLINELNSPTVKEIQTSLNHKTLANNEKQEIKFHIPFWVIISCALAMGLGTLVGGWRIIHTLGSKMMKMQPIHGFAANTASAAIILTASSFGMPVSTTHIVSTSIMGVGASKRFSAVKWGVVGNIVMAWVLTFPISFAISWVLFHVLNFVF